MADKNALEQLKDALNDLNDFLSINQDKIKALVKAAKELFPPVSTVFTSLVELLDKLKTAVDNFKLPDVAGTVGDLAKKSGALLGAIRAFLSKDDDAEVKRVEDAISAVASLTDFDKLKDELKAEIQQVRDLLASLSAAS